MSRWSFASTAFAALIAAAASASGTYQSVHKCDEYAAHPDDLMKWANGVADEDLIPGPSIKFCRDAVRDHPGTTRFHFQLGRALLKGNQIADAIDAFANAAQADYPPAYSYLGDVYNAGTLGEPDFEKAAAYYDIAIEGGFLPAEASKNAMLSANAEPTTTAAAGSDPDTTPDQKVDLCGVNKLAKMIEQSEHPLDEETVLDASLFSRGHTLRNLYAGNFDALDKESEFGVLLYFSHMNNYFSENMNWYSESCAAYADPELSKITMQRAQNAIGIGGNDLAQQGENIMRMMANIVQGGPGRLMEGAQNIEVTVRAAKSDATRLAKFYGCASPVFGKLYANMGNYLRGQEPACASGWPGLRLVCLRYATQRGGYHDSSRKLCRCIADAFKESGVSDREAEWLRVNYDHTKNFGTVAGRHEGLDEKIGNCLL